MCPNVRTEYGEVQIFYQNSKKMALASLTYVRYVKMVVLVY
jgi:hypothetical protein